MCYNANKIKYKINGSHKSRYVLQKLNANYNCNRMPLLYSYYIIFTSILFILVGANLSGLGSITTTLMKKSI